MLKGVILFSLCLTFLACKKVDTAEAVPNCVDKKIHEILEVDPHSTAAEVWKWETGDKTYYYFTSDCCDQFNYLYDTDCNLVCAPDGGLSGGGSGDCPEFTNLIEKTLVWEDDRN
jgi:hypothetical protein